MVFASLIAPEINGGEKNNDQFPERTIPPQWSLFLFHEINRQVWAHNYAFPWQIP